MFEESSVGSTAAGRGARRWKEVVVGSSLSLPPVGSTFIGVFIPRMLNGDHFVAVARRTDNDRLEFPGHKGLLWSIRTLLYWNSDKTAHPTVAMLSN